MYNKIGNIYNKLEEYLLISSLVFTVCLIFYQVVMRYVFKNSSFWSEEMARYIFIWQIWLGASIGFKDDKHIKIEMLTGRLSGKPKAFFSLLSDLCMLAFCAFVVVKGWEFLRLTAKMRMVTPALRISYVYVYAALPVSALAVIGRMLGATWNDLKMLAGKA